MLFAFCDHTAKRPTAAEGVKVPTVLTGGNKGENADIIRKLDPENPCFKDAKGEYDPNPVAHLRYFVWEAALDGSWVRQLTGTPKDPMETWGGRQTSLIEDADPCYLPDGGFVFNSTRCQSFGRCHWGRYTPAFLLYRADKDDPRYQALLALVQGAIAPQAHQDHLGTCGRGKDCVCNSCWIWMGRFNEPAPGAAPK